MAAPPAQLRQFLVYISASNWSLLEFVHCLNVIIIRMICYFDFPADFPYMFSINYVIAIVKNSYDFYLNMH